MAKRVADQSKRQMIRMYDELTWPEVAAVGIGAPIMIPAGGTEQQGENLLLGTDTIQGVEIILRAVARLARPKIGAIRLDKSPDLPGARQNDSDKEMSIKCER